MESKLMIDQSLDRVKDFLMKQVNTDRPGIKRCSSYHDIEAYPDMCLPATYNATHALILLGAYDHLEEIEKKSIADYILSYQMESGVFRFKQMKSDEIWKGKSIDYSWQYIDNHITNYSIGALKSLGYTWNYPLSFINLLKTPDNLEHWLSERDMTDPWMEGNNIVNLSSFLICEMEGKEDERLQELMEIVFRWHDKSQDSVTGYWGTNHPDRPAGLTEGMAGAAHNFHLYFYYNREIPYYKAIVDHCLEFIKGKVKSSCLDVDVVDILVNLAVYGYRTEEIKITLKEFAQKLVKFQNSDGGFADEKTNGVRRMDGWVKGYFEPQGLSNCFASWFRSLTLAMISCLLYPEDASRYTFRNSIGIGYFNKNYLK